MSYDTILVGYDGSENAKRALNKAVELAKESKAQLRIVVAADIANHTIFSGAGSDDRLRGEVVQTAKNLLSDATYTAKKGGVTDVYGSVEEGQPADMILTLSTEYKASLIVVGRRGVRGLQRFLMGSVSSAVINNATCDVLVVK